MSIQSIAKFTSQTPPAGLLALNAGRKAAAPDAPARPLRAWRQLIRIGSLTWMSCSPSAGPQRCGRGGFRTPAATEGMLADPVMERLLLAGPDRGRDGDGDITATRSARSRRPLAQAALAAGVREPQQDVNEGALQKWRLKRVMTYVEEHIGETISLADLANAAGLSRMYFATRFRPQRAAAARCVLRRRVESAKDMLVRTNEPRRDRLQRRLPDAGPFHDGLRAAGVTPGRWRSSSRQFA